MAILRGVWRVCLYLGVIFGIAVSAGMPAAPQSGDSTPGSAQGATLIVLAGDGASTPTRVLRVRGEPAEMGYQIGAGLRAEIRQAVSIALQLCAAGYAGDGSCSLRAEALRAALSPALLQELQGIARGANVSESDLLLVNSLSDRLFVGDAGVNNAAFAAWDAATVDGTSLLGGVWGRSEYANPLWIARQPAREDATFLLSLPGWLGGMAGMNDNGVSAFSLPIQTADVATEGAPATIILRQALAGSDTPQEAIARVVAQRHHAGAQMWFASGQNGVAGVEFTARLLRMLQPDVNTFVSVGLYAHPRLAETQLFESDPERLTWLNARWRDMESTVRTNVGWIGVEKSLAMLRDMAGDEGGLLVLMDAAAETIWFGLTEADGGELLTFQPFDLLSE